MDEKRTTPRTETNPLTAPVAAARAPGTTGRRRTQLGGTAALVLAAALALPGTAAAAPTATDTTQGAPVSAATATTTQSATAQVSDQEANRPRNGTVLIKRGSGRGELTVNNTGSHTDAVVTLSRSNRAVLVLYVRAGATATATKIPDGTYDVFAEQGHTWDPAGQRFTLPTSAGQFDRQADFRTERTADGVRYTTIDLTLFAVPDGNTQILPVPDASIPG